MAFIIFVIHCPADARQEGLRLLSVGADKKALKPLKLPLSLAEFPFQASVLHTKRWASPGEAFVGEPSQFPAVVLGEHALTDSEDDEALLLRLTRADKGTTGNTV